MQVSSLELSKELYELSGWGPNQWWAKSSYSGEWTVIPEKNYSRPEYADEAGAGQFYDPEPAYDAGYLLRALPADLPNPEWGGFDQPKKVPLELAHVMAGAGEWWAKYHVRYNVPIACVYADTAENALCKLAIELFKTGVLEKGGEK